MRKGQAFLHDFAVTVLFGALVACGLLLVLLLIGLLFGGDGVLGGLAAARSGLLIVGALALLLCAGLLIRPGGSEKIRTHAQWQRHFKVFGLLPVVLITAVLVLAAACLVDYRLVRFAA